MISPFDEIKEIFEIEVYPHDLINDETTNNFLNKTKEQLTNNKWPLAILFYNSPFIPQDSLFASLNSFAESIQNPFIFCIGDDLNTYDSLQLNFVMSRHRYFEFEAKTLWERTSKQSVDFNLTKSKKFLYATLKDYPIRKFLLANIINSGNINAGFIGYSRKVITDYSNELEHNNIKVKTVADSIDHLFPLPDLDTHGDWVQMDYKFRTDSYINIVTDTFFHLDPNILFLSEKVFNAMAFGQLFMYLGPAGSLKYLRMAGYETFSDYIDESYDEIYDPYERLLAFNKSMLQLLAKSLGEIEHIYKQCMPRLIKNRDKLFNTNFKQSVCKDLEYAKKFKNK